MKSKKLMVLSVALCLLPSAAGLLLWDKLPARIATHFNFNGVADGWSSKGYAVFFLPMMLAALDALCLFAVRCDKAAQQQSRALQTFFLWLVPVLSCAVMALLYLTALGFAVRVDLYIALLLGAVFLVVGALLPKCRRNNTMGIKLPWTLGSDENWDYTHRIGGFCFVGCGAVTLVGALLGQLWLLLPCIVLAIAVPMLASYSYYRKNERKE